MSQAIIPGFEREADRRASETDHAAREDSPTPPLLVRAILEAVARRLYVGADFTSGQHQPCLRWSVAGAEDRQISEPGEAIRVLDVCSGYGVWSQQMRALARRQGWPVHITGVEICEARREHLVKWCDDVRVGDWRACLSLPAMRLRHWSGRRTAPREVPSSWDLVVGNPHFTALTYEDPEQSMVAVLLEHAPAVLLLHTLNAFVRGPGGRAVARAYPPAASWIVPGTVSFDGTSNVASDCYAASLWLRDYEGPTVTRLLDADPLEVNRAAGLLKAGGDPYACWRWRGDPPGSETPAQAEAMGLSLAPEYTATARCTAS